MLNEDRVPMYLDPGALFRDHSTAVWRYTRARLPSDVDAEDVTSDVFARAIRSIDGYQPALGTPRAWLIGIAQRAVADWWRRRRPEDPTMQLPDTGHRGHDDSGPEVVAERAAAIDAVRPLLEALSDREREAIALRFGAELSSAEIGAVLGTSATAARMLVHRAVTKLRGMIDHD